MKTTIGGDRLGSGSKQEVSMRNYERSTHDLSYLWRTSMSAGTLVPFMVQLALPGDVYDINLNAEVMTLPTIGPLFGSYKVQLDVFEVPMRLYNAKLHMNKLGIGMDMSKIFIPQINLKVNNHANYVQTFEDDEHVHNSCLMKYLGVSGLGKIDGITNPASRYFNAVPLLAYWDIYKNYYSNKQEEVGYFVHTDQTSMDDAMTPIKAQCFNELQLIGDCLDPDLVIGVLGMSCEIKYGDNAQEPNPYLIAVGNDGSPDLLSELFTSFEWIEASKTLVCIGYKLNAVEFTVLEEASAYAGEFQTMGLKQFDLTVIDDMREKILQFTGAAEFVIESADDLPYSCFMTTTGTDENLKYGLQRNQEGLAIKTYQSDLFNNWISTEWIDGEDGINAITAVSTVGDEFTIDALNLAQKVYVMLNRIAISGGTYDDWLDAVYTHERVKGIESPVYHGSLIKELGFEEVISNAETTDQPLGTLAGRGRLNSKNKGGRMHIKVSEPSYIIGLVSLTPKIDYSQGNAWDVNLKTFDDFHKPALDAIGFQDLIVEQMLWTDTSLDSATRAITQHSLGKQPAWINYMTNVNKVYGNFADRNKEMFMTLNRRYEKDTDGTILDGTTYIDPVKFNQIFAETRIDSQNFWVQIANNITARRKMSAKIIPNL